MLDTRLVAIPTLKNEAGFEDWSHCFRRQLNTMSIEASDYLKEAENEGFLEEESEGTVEDKNYDKISAEVYDLLCRSIEQGSSAYQVVKNTANFKGFDAETDMPPTLIWLQGGPGAPSTYGESPKEDEEGGVGSVFPFSYDPNVRLFVRIGPSVRLWLHRSVVGSARVRQRSAVSCWRCRAVRIRAHCPITLCHA